MECEGLSAEQLRIVMEFADLVEKEFWVPLLEVISKREAVSLKEFKELAKKIFDEVITIEEEV